MADFMREVRFEKGYDYRDDPDDNRGASGLKIRLILRGPLGAITAVVSTGWMAAPLIGRYHPGRTQQHRRREPGLDAGLVDCYPTGGGIASHCAQKHEDWWLGPQECDVLGGECYGNQGYLVSDELLLRLIRDGEEAAWDYLRECYDEWIGGAAC